MRGSAERAERTLIHYENLIGVASESKEKAKAADLLSVVLAEAQAHALLAIVYELKELRELIRDQELIRG